MLISGKRGRIVSFRVTDEEYSALQQASAARGAHSISEYARKATCNGIAEGSAEPAVDLMAEVKLLRQRLDELFDFVNHLAARVGGEPQLVEQEKAEHANAN